MWNISNKVDCIKPERCTESRQSFVSDVCRLENGETALRSHYKQDVTTDLNMDDVSKTHSQ